MKDLDKYMSAPQCADMAGIEPDTFTAYVNRGKAPPPVVRIGGRRFYDRAEIVEWVTARVTRSTATGGD